MENAVMTVLDDLEARALVDSAESPVALAERLVRELEPQEIQYALLKAGCGRDGTFAPDGEGLTHDNILEIVGLPKWSSINRKEEVKQLVALLRAGIEADITPMISAMQGLSLLKAYEVKLGMMHDTKTDSKVRNNIASDFLDRDPRGRTLKQKVQINQNNSGENEGVRMFKEACARREAISGVATETVRSIEFHTEPIEETAPCPTPQE